MTFSKARKRTEPVGLAAFAAGAPGASAVAATEATEKREYEITIGLGADEHAALERIAAHEDRSKRKVIRRLLGPALLAAAKKIARSAGGDGSADD